jgi:feruloyl esterase
LATDIFSRYEYGAEIGYSTSGDLAGRAQKVLVVWLTSLVYLIAGLFGEQAFSIPQEYYRYWVFNDTSFDIATLTYDDILEAKRRNVGDITSVNPDIRAFVKRGGKLLQYHGLADQLISRAYEYEYTQTRSRSRFIWLIPGSFILPAGSSLRYYSSVDAFTRFNTNQKTDDFYRYFPVPGLLHCGGGPGINSIGTSQAVCPNLSHWLNTCISTVDID